MRTTPTMMQMSLRNQFKAGRQKEMAGEKGDLTPCFH